MSQTAVFIDGAEGTTGLQIRERLARCTNIEIMTIDAEDRKKSCIRQNYINAANLVILCLPDDAAREAVGMIRPCNTSVRVLDASTAHRTNPAWVYGFPELSAKQEDSIRSARFVANPGCYATGAIALLAPLIEADLLPADAAYSISGTSGYSGAGRSVIEVCEGKNGAPLPPHLELYAVGRLHKHVSEMQIFSGLTRTPFFQPTLSNTVRQGMIVSIPVDLDSVRVNGDTQTRARALQEKLAAHYEGCTHVRVKEADDISTHRLALDGLSGSDDMELFVVPYPKARQALLLARLDNLGKGAAGAAVQNLNLMLG